MNSVFEHDATPTWSGFIYQGLVAVYLAVKETCKLMQPQNELSKEEIGKIYGLEIENCEDVAIIRVEQEEKHYLSIHQVKNRKEQKIGDYKKALIQLMLEKGFLKARNLGCPEAYLHSSSKIKEDESKICQLLISWKKRVLEFYNKLESFMKTKEEESNRTDLQRNMKEVILNEPIGLNRTEYKDLLRKIRDNIEKNCDLEVLKKSVENLKDYLEYELAVKSMDEDVKLYQYEGNVQFGSEDDLFQKIVEQVEEYKRITKSSDHLIKEQYEYIADKLLGYMRNFILDRHESKKKNKEYQIGFWFQDIIRIMDEGISEDEAKANIEALRRVYSEALSEYCMIICKNGCEGKEGYECRLLDAKYSKVDLTDEEFIRMCFMYNPNCSTNISVRTCISELMHRDGLQESVFEILKKVPDKYFIEENDRTRTVLKDEMDNALLTAISGKSAERVVRKIVKGINRNTELVSPIFEADKLITAELDSKDEMLWERDYSEISEKYMSREAVESSEDNQNNFCQPKKPKFVKAEDMLGKLN